MVVWKFSKYNGKSLLDFSIILRVNYSYFVTPDAFSKEYEILLPMPAVGIGVVVPTPEPTPNFQS